MDRGSHLHFYQIPLSSTTHSDARRGGTHIRQYVYWQIILAGRFPEMEGLRQGLFAVAITVAQEQQCLRALYQLGQTKVVD